MSKASRCCQHTHCMVSTPLGMPGNVNGKFVNMIPNVITYTLNLAPQNSPRDHKTKQISGEGHCPPTPLPRSVPRCGGENPIPTPHLLRRFFPPTLNSRWRQAACSTVCRQHRDAFEIIPLLGDWCTHFAVVLYRRHAKRIVFTHTERHNDASLRLSWTLRAFNISHDCTPGTAHVVSQSVTATDYHRFALGRAPRWRSTFIATGARWLPSRCCFVAPRWTDVRVRQTNDRSTWCRSFDRNNAALQCSGH